MKKIFVFSFLFLFLFSMFSCTENYSNGERIGLITKFSKQGVFWKSWEGHLNLTQTGMNSSEPFDFSLDNDQENGTLVAAIDSAAQHGWKVKLTYHQTLGKNWFGNRGSTNHFVEKCEILDKNPTKTALGVSSNTTSVTHDTIYLVIYRNQ